MIRRIRPRHSGNPGTSDSSGAGRSEAIRVLVRGRFAVHAAGIGVVLVMAASGPAGQAGSAVAQGPGPGSGPGAAGGYTYRLVDDWRDRPWELTAGRFGKASDISSAPDGTVYVLDNRTDAGRPSAIHVLAADGTVLRAFEIPNQFLSDRRWLAQRLDVGADGTVHVLSASNLRIGGVLQVLVQRLDGERELSRFELEVEYPASYTDIAVRDDGRIYMTRTGWNPWCIRPEPSPTPEAASRSSARSAGPARAYGVAQAEPPPHSIDVFESDGTLVASLAPEEMAIPQAIDVDAEGSAHIVNRVPSLCGGEPPPDEPTPTPRPSIAGADPLSRSRGSAVDARAAAPLADPIDGVLVLNPDHTVRETIPFIDAEDVAVGPAGVFVSRQAEIFAVRKTGGRSAFEDLPLHTGPSGRAYAAFLGRRVFSLDAPRDGRLLAGMNHCYFQGIVRFDAPSSRPAPFQRLGAIDAPELEGPAHPIRVAADDEVAVLLGRTDIRGSRPGQVYESTSVAWQPQTVQRWSRGGDLGSQLGLCAGSDTWWTRDVAVDGTSVYTIDTDFLQFRPDNDIPAWSYWPGLLLDDPDAVSYLEAVDADGGRAAVLDIGSNSVVMADEAGTVERSWATGEGILVDIALRGDRVYLADSGNSAVQVRTLEGDEIGAWPTHDGPRAIATGKDGDVYVLGRGGWGYRYSPSGELRAAWAMPDRMLEARDIAVGAAGRVYVNYVAYGEPAVMTWDSREPIEAAGVWVFEPETLPDRPELPPADGCTAVPDKSAAPNRIPLGDIVEVTLDVVGSCPGSRSPAQLLFVFDTSRSMNFDDSMGLGRDSVLGILAELDPATSEAGLVTFDSGTTLKEPLTGDISAVRAAVAALKADGDTRLAGGLGAALLELTGPRGRPDVRQVIVLVTDGVFNDEVYPITLSDEIRAAGIELLALVYPNGGLEDDDLVNLESLVGGAEQLHLNPAPSSIRALADLLSGYTPEEGLFETITIVDRIPANMRYVPDSARPPAAFDAAANELTWTFGRRMVWEPLTMKFDLEPLEVGTWPTNIGATATYTDALGVAGNLVFPIPEVEVYALDNQVYLPFGVNRACLRKARPVDVALVIDASSSMREPAAGDAGTKIEAARSAQMVSQSGRGSATMRSAIRRNCGVASG